MSRKPTFFTSDTHYFHANVLKYSNRPFRDLEHMHQVLINNYNAVVPKDGICYFLGDVGFCKQEKLKEIIAQLNGTKVLILGNHDLGMNAMYSAGFDVVCYGVTLQICQQRVTLSHCPLKGIYRENTEGMRGAIKGDNWHGENNPKRARFTTPDNGQFHLAGHLHAPNNGKSQVKLDRQWDIGVDGNNFTPVSISAIESWIVKILKEERLM